MARTVVPFTQPQVTPIGKYGSFSRTLGGAVAGSVAGDAIVSGTITGLGALIGSDSGLGTATGTLLASSVLAGSSSGTVTFIATLTGSGVLDGSAAGDSTVTGTARPSAAAIGIGTATGTLLGSGRLAGSLTGTVTATGNLTDVTFYSPLPTPAITQLRAWSPWVGSRYGSFDKTPPVPEADFLYGSLDVFPHLSGTITLTTYICGEIIVDASLSGRIQVNP